MIALDFVGSPMDIEVETDVDKFPVAHPASSNAIKTSDSAGCAFATSCDAMPGIVSVTSTDVNARAVDTSPPFVPAASRSALARVLLSRRTA